MQLEALPAADTGRLLGELLGAEVPNPIRDLVVGRAEGNPFFVEELVGTLIDRGVLARDNGTWSFGELPPGFTVPDSVQAVLAARIDLLPAPEKAALQAASVIGRTFWTGPVYELVAGDSPDIGVLEERDFVRRRPGSSLAGEREYVIKHALTREVAYASLPKARRARLHAAFAEWLESRAEERDELAPLLAHHFSQAVRPEDRDLAWEGEGDVADGLRERAVTWSRRAAELALGRYEIDECLSLLRQAVALEPEKAAQASLWYEIGHASALKYDGEGFVAALMKALELGAPEAQVFPELAYQTAFRAGMWQRRLDDALVEGWVERAVAVAPEGTPDRVKALAAQAFRHDDVDTARLALALADELGDVGLRFIGLNAVEGALWWSGRYGEACEIATVALEMLPAIEDPDLRADMFRQTAEIYANVGRLDDARAATTQLEETVAGLTPHHRVHGIGTRLVLETAVADWEATRSLTQRAEDLVEANLATPCPFNVGILLMVALGWAYGGDTSQVERLAEKAESIGMVGYGITHSPRWLRLAIARHDLQEVRRVVDSIRPEWLHPAAWELRSALFDGLLLLDDRDRLETETGAWLEGPTYEVPFAIRALGVVRNDRALLADAVDRFEAMGLAWHAQETRRLLEP
jgi:hypothetical protein